MAKDYESGQMTTIPQFEARTTMPHHLNPWHHGLLYSSYHGDAIPNPSSKFRLAKNLVPSGSETTEQWQIISITDVFTSSAFMTGLLNHLTDGVSFHLQSCRRHFVLSTTLLPLWPFSTQGLRSKSTEGVADIQYDMTISGGVDLCPPLKGFQVLVEYKSSMFP